MGRAWKRAEADAADLGCPYIVLAQRGKATKCFGVMGGAILPAKRDSVEVPLHDTDGPSPDPDPELEGLTFCKKCALILELKKQDEPRPPVGGLDSFDSASAPG
jgi:hypothetical protein